MKVGSNQGMMLGFMRHLGGDVWSARSGWRWASNSRTYIIMNSLLRLGLVEIDRSEYRITPEGSPIADTYAGIIREMGIDPPTSKDLAPL